jgi:hypothetical protein
MDSLKIIGQLKRVAKKLIEERVEFKRVIPEDEEAVIGEQEAQYVFDIVFDKTDVHSNSYDNNI